MTSRPSTIRGVAAAQAALGATLLARPGLATAGSSRARPYRSVPHWVVRVLGARMAVQGLVEAATPSARVARLGAAVDGLHATSMLGVAAVSPGFRAAALRSAAIAGASAGALLASSLTPLEVADR